ncbi:insulinase family protein, partial [Microbacteriaceae bacterium K1510]|nr:insulinase family protein [Microbacteriaceae bacterium K1510]
MEVAVIADHRTPVVSHTLWYRVGAADEPEGLSGVARLLEHLMFKSQDDLAEGEFSKIITDLGGVHSA